MLVTTSWMISVPHMLGLGLELVHQPGALDRLGEARIILDIGGDGELPAGLHAGDQHGLQPGARGIDRGGIAGRAGTEDEKARAVGVGQGSIPGNLGENEHICH